MAMLAFLAGENVTVRENTRYVTPWPIGIHNDTHLVNQAIDYGALITIETLASGDDYNLDGIGSTTSTGAIPELSMLIVFIVFSSSTVVQKH